MIDPVSIFVAIKVITLVVALLLLTLNEIVNWFSDYHTEHSLTEDVANEVGFTILNKLATNDFETIQGVFNKSTEKVTDGRIIKSSHIDDKFAGYHRSKELVIYS